MSTINSIIEQAVQQNATDIYLLDGQLPKVKVDNKMQTLSGVSPVNGNSLKRELEYWLNEDQIQELDKNQNIKFVIET